MIAVYDRSSVDIAPEILEQTEFQRFFFFFWQEANVMTPVTVYIPWQILALSVREVFWNALVRLSLISVIFFFHFHSPVVGYLIWAALFCRATVDDRCWLNTHIISRKPRPKNIGVKPMVMSRLVIPACSFSATVTLVARRCWLACLVELLQMAVWSNNLLKSPPSFVLFCFCYFVGFSEDAVTKGAATGNVNSCLSFQMVKLPAQTQLKLSFRPYPVI